MKMIEFEDCIRTNEVNYSCVYEWFLCQNHVPFNVSGDNSSLYPLYLEFLEELYQLYSKTGNKYYWFTQKGELISDKGQDIVSVNSIKVNKKKVRSFKLNQLLNI